MSTPFSKPINIFLNEIDDSELALYSAIDLKKYLDDLVIISANADFTYCDKTKDLSQYTESVFTNSVLTTDGSFDDSLTLVECNIIAKYMLLRYLNGKIYNESLLKQSLGDKDYSQSRIVAMSFCEPRSW